MNLPKNSFPLFLLILPLLVSCGEDHALKKEKFYIEEENRTWMPADTLPDVFWMRDNNGITTSYVRHGEDHYFNKSWSSFLGVNTRMSLTEYQYQEFRSPFGNTLHISLTAGWPPYGDELYVSLDGTAFAWDFNYKTVSRLEHGDMMLSRLITDNGYEDQQPPITSFVEMLDTLQAGGRIYHNVMHFTLTDFSGTPPASP